MPRFPPRWLLVLAGSLVIASCATDDPVAPTDRPPPIGTTRIAPAVAATADTADLPAHPRYTLTVAADGPFRPDLPVNLRITVAAATRPTPSTELAVYVPELQAFQADPARYGGVPAGMPLTPATAWTFGVAAGASVARTATLTFPEPGLYALQVIARQLVPDPKPFDWTKDGETVNAWVLVTEEGGRFSLAYDSSMILPDAVAGGPYRKLKGGTLANFCDPQVPGSCPPRNCCIGGTLTYSNPVSGVAEPMRNVVVEVDYPNGEIFQATASPTGGFGGLACPQSGETGFVYFKTSNFNAGFTVANHGATGFQFASVTSSSCGTNLMTHNSTLPAPVVFEHLVTTRANALTLFGRQRGFINVYIKAPTECNLSHYSGGSDTITICDDAVYGQYGGFVHAHEYGHAFMAATFGHGNPTSGQCTVPHYVDTPNTAGCAISEGWADYFSVVSYPTSHPTFNPAEFESNSWVLSYPSQGRLIEGAVAAYYLDVSDGTNPSENDNQALGAVFVADMISSCENINLGPPTDIGGLRFCFEQNLTPSSTYWLNPTVPYPPQWTLAPMQADYAWNIDANR